MIDWDEPTNSTDYTDVLDELKDRDISNAKMNYSAGPDSNLVSGMIGFDGTNNYFEKYNGSSWAELGIEQITGPSGENLKLRAAASQNIEFHPFNTQRWSLTEYDMIPASNVASDIGSTTNALAEVWTAAIKGAASSTLTIDANGDLDLAIAGTVYLTLESAGVLNFRNMATNPTAGALAKYLQVQESGTNYYLPLYATS